MGDFFLLHPLSVALSFPLLSTHGRALMGKWSAGALAAGAWPKALELYLFEVMSSLRPVGEIVCSMAPATHTHTTHFDTHTHTHTHTLIHTTTHTHTHTHTALARKIQASIGTL